MRCEWCGAVMFWPRRGPSPKTCSTACRTSLSRSKKILTSCNPSDHVATLQKIEEAKSRARAKREAKA